MIQIGSGISLTIKWILEKRSTEYLVVDQENDSTLIVRKTALESYRTITKFEKENMDNVFDFKGAIAVWGKRKIK